MGVGGGTGGDFGGEGSGTGGTGGGGSGRVDGGADRIGRGDVRVSADGLAASTKATAVVSIGLGEESWNVTRKDDFLYSCRVAHVYAGL